MGIATGGEAAYFQPKVPPPVAGTVHPLRLLYRFLHNPLEVWADFQFVEMRQSFRYFGIEATLLNDPQDIRTCFSTNKHLLEHEPIRLRMMRPLLGRGVLCAEGEEWLAGRRMLAQALSRDMIAASAARIRTTVAELADACIGAGAQLRASDLADRITLKVMSDLMFSGDLDAETGTLLPAIHGCFESCRLELADLIGLPGWFPRPSQIKGWAHRRKLRLAVRRFCETRRKATGSSAVDDGAGRMLAEAARLGLPHELVEDNLVTLIVTGHETLACTLCWTLYLLSRSPACLHKVTEEIDQVGATESDPATWPAKLPYLAACLNEAMRLFPPGPIISRKLSEDIWLGSQRLPPGSIVFVNTWILHRHLLHWPSAAAFKPERFLPENRASRPEGAFLPFGIGQRACIGSHLAVTEAIVALAVLLGRYRIEYAGESEPNPVMRVTIRADNGIPMRFSRRGDR